MRGIVLRRFSWRMYLRGEGFKKCRDEFPPFMHLPVLIKIHPHRESSRLKIRQAASGETDCRR
jgi:hypothetical protein